MGRESRVLRKIHERVQNFQKKEDDILKESLIYSDMKLKDEKVIRDN